MTRKAAAPEQGMHSKHRSGAGRADALIQNGRNALVHGQWENARASFTDALSVAESPEALEGLGMAAWWLDDGATVFETRERAYRLYRQRGDPRAAARVAMTLAEDHFCFRGEAAVAKGWHRRAYRLLEGLDVVLEHGWLKFWEGAFGLRVGEDPAQVRRLAAEAAVVGRSLGDTDLEMTALALEGVALVTEGALSEGMPRLDEAGTAALSGEMTDPMAIGLSCCYLMAACERIRDFDRAAQWCANVKDFAARIRFNAVLGICRAEYAGVLMWRGSWTEAEMELKAAARQLAVTRPAMQAEALLRLADLRRQQGRFAEAGALLKQIEGHPRAVLGCAILALDRGDTKTAEHLARRLLRHAPKSSRTDRVSALDILLRAQVALKQMLELDAVLGELRSIATTVGTASFRACAYTAEGIAAAASGDHDHACDCFEDAIDLYRQSGAAYEQARTRLELGRSLMRLGQPSLAEAELRESERVFQQLGSGWQADRAVTLLHELSSGSSKDARGNSGAGSLTPRETEVLRFVAQGLSNQKIARRLFVSEFTIKRHVANILTKLDLPSRAAAAAYAAQNGLL